MSDDQETPKGILGDLPKPPTEKPTTIPPPTLGLGVKLPVLGFDDKPPAAEQEKEPDNSGDA
jgi:hypothetical protein